MRPVLDDGLVPNVGNDRRSTSSGLFTSLSSTLIGPPSRTTEADGNADEDEEGVGCVGVAAVGIVVDVAAVAFVVDVDVVAAVAMFCAVVVVSAAFGDVAAVAADAGAVPASFAVRECQSNSYGHAVPRAP